jgi:hypothetical protein
MPRKYGCASPTSRFLGRGVQVWTQLLRAQLLPSTTPDRAAWDSSRHQYVAERVDRQGAEIFRAFMRSTGSDTLRFCHLSRRRSGASDHRTEAHHCRQRLHIDCSRVAVSGACGIERCSPRPVPFPPQPPQKVSLPCSAGSQVLRHSPTSPARARPPFGLWPSRTGLDRQTKACWRSRGSRACCFLACAGS